MPSERWTPEIAASQRRRARMTDTSIQIELLGKHLARQKKSALVEMLVQAATEERSLLRRLQIAFPQKLPLHLLAITVRQAIEEATKIDQSRLNRNFAYDRLAYESAQLGFEQLISRANESLTREGAQQLERVLDFDNPLEVADAPPTTGLELALHLAVVLARDGSNQMAASDEGMMQEEIEACLRPVIGALRNSPLDRDQVNRWLTKIIAADACGVLCYHELQEITSFQGR